MPQQEKYNWFGEQSDNNAGGNGNGNGWGHNGGGPGNHNGGGYGTSEPPDDVDPVPIDKGIPGLFVLALLLLILITLKKTLNDRKNNMFLKRKT